MAKLNKQLHLISELNQINDELIPLKELADRELTSIHGLTGMLYTPHIDTYMRFSIKKAEILACLKRQKILPLSKVELISTELNKVHNKAKNHAVVSYEGSHYQHRFLPLKLSKSGKSIQKWAKFWLLQNSDGKINSEWESQVREIWPTYFLIRAVNL